MLCGEVVKLIKKIYHHLYYIVLRKLFLNSLYKSASQESTVVVFDIDNTLSKTRASETVDFCSSLPRHENMCLIAEYFCSRVNYNVFFLSVRPLRFLNDTRVWLKKNINSPEKHSVFFTKTPQQKIDLLHSLNLQSRVIFFDDMSYGSFGNVRFFDSVIDAIDESKIIHLGLDFIDESSSNSIDNSLQKILDAC